MKKKAKIESERVWLGVTAACEKCIPSGRAPIITRNYAPDGNLRYTRTWNEAVDVLHEYAKELPDSTQIYTFISYCAGMWTKLPEHLSLNSSRNITTLKIQCYPTLEHVDVGNLPNLTRFELERDFDKPLNYIGRYLRISGLAKCLRLDYLSLFGYEGSPYLLRIKAPVHELRALTLVFIGSSCMNRRLPLELGSSPLLKHFSFNGTSMLRTINAKRNFATCLCIALYWQITRKSSALVKALVSGPIHDPSLIHDIANKLSVKLD